METQAEPSVGQRIEEIFRAFESKAVADSAAAASVVFDLRGDAGGRHLVRVSPAGMEWEGGYSGDADVVVKLSVEDFLAIADGTFDGRLAVASERIEVDGNLDLAESLLGWLDPDQA